MRLVVVDATLRNECYVSVPDGPACLAESILDAIFDQCHWKLLVPRSAAAMVVLRDGPEVDRPLRSHPRLLLITADDVIALREDDTVQVVDQNSSIIRDGSLPHLSAYPLQPMTTIGDVSATPSGAPVFTLSLAEQDLVMQKAMTTAIEEHGHFYVELSPSQFEKICKAQTVAEEFFTMCCCRGAKWRMPMDPDERTWGWHCMHGKHKEILKLRDVPTMHAHWPHDAVAFAPFAECMEAVRGVAEDICTALVTGLGVDPTAFRASISRASPIDPRDEFTASFYECFRYASFPTHLAGGKPFYVPCEMHQDVGIITMSMRSRGPRGLQVMHPTTSRWIDAEAPMDNNRPLVVVFSGDSMSYISRGKLKPTSHRVVLPCHGHDQSGGGTNRYSTIYEVLPHPKAVVPQVPPVDGEANGVSSALTGRDVCVISSVGKSSINWK